MVKKKTCVFISGQGSNLKNLISRSRDNNFPIKIDLVISNNKNAHGIIPIFIKPDPIETKKNMSVPIAVFDYDNNKNYRILIAMENELSNPISISLPVGTNYNKKGTAERP